jgi:hypothetical protein
VIFDATRETGAAHRTSRPPDLVSLIDDDHIARYVTSECLTSLLYDTIRGNFLKELVTISISYDKQMLISESVRFSHLKFRSTS